MRIDCNEDSVIFSLDCNFTLGVSIIDNYVEYIQETIREINKKDKR